MKIIKYTIALFLSIGIIGCTHNFEEINSNPNAPDKITNPGFLLPNVIRSSVNTYFTTSFTRGSTTGDLLFNDFASNPANWSRTDAPSHFYWGFYDQIRELNEVIRVAEERTTNNYVGVSLILRAWMFQSLTDLYGPIPYKEAAQAKINGNSTPKYNSQQEVYAGLIEDLERAIMLLGSTNEPVIGDILFDGDLTRWKKTATGLLLRLAMRQSNVVNPSELITRIVNDQVKYPLFSSHQEQAALTYLADRLENESPLFRRSNVDYSTSTRVTKNLIDHLSALQDPRLFVFALPTESSSTLLPNGEYPSKASFEYKGAENGEGPVIDAQNYSAPGMLWAPNQFSPSLASPNAAQAILISFSEVQFILAEAAERGFIPGGSSQANTYYLEGIADQFSYYASRIGNRYANSYLQLTAADLNPSEAYYASENVQYGGTQEERLQKIYLQKWLSLYMCGYEAWSEVRRTGFPIIKVGSLGAGYLPQRALYPADEQRLNPENYNAAIQMLGADDVKTKVWWAK